MDSAPPPRGRPSLTNLDHNPFSLSEVEGHGNTSPIRDEDRIMDAQYFLTLANQSMWVLALAAAPILVPVLVSGLVIGMIQAATSINEQTLSFVPKLIVVAVSILIFGSLIVGLLSDFMVSMFERIPDLVK